MNWFHLSAALIALSAFASYLNYRTLRLPASIALMGAALLLAAALVALGMAGRIAEMLGRVDFTAIVLHGVLGFILFAGALHADIGSLRSQAPIVAVLATAGVVISTFITGGALWLVAGALGFEIPLPLALLFGALIAPTDPVAVLAIMRQVGASERMSIKITGESLLNDGVAVVVFVALIGTVTSGTPPHATELALFLAQEVLGAIVLGAAVGFAGYRLLRGVDDYLTETLITLAVAMAGYSLGETAGVSAPITVVTAGLIIGSRGRKYAMSGNTRARVDSFWALVDYVLNAALFVLMGLEVLAVPFGDVPGRGGWIALLAIPVTLLARLVSVALPVIALGARRRFERGTIPVLTWGGLKGGVSMALALAVPDTGHRDFVLTATYAVVLFSIFVQGLTVRRLVARYVERD